MFNAFLLSAALLHCAKFLNRFDDNRMKVSLAKAKMNTVGEANNIISKVNVSASCRRRVASE